MYPNPYLIERLAQHNVTEAQRRSRYAWLYIRLRKPVLRGLLTAAASIVQNSIKMLTLPYAWY
jgi:hypothetical protein